MPRAPSKLFVPLVAFVLTMGALAVVGVLLERANASSEAQLHGSLLAPAESDLASAPLDVSPSNGTRLAQARIGNDEELLAQGLTRSAQPNVPMALLTRARADVAALESTVGEIPLGASQ